MLPEIIIMNYPGSAVEALRHAEWIIAKLISDTEHVAAPKRMKELQDCQAVIAEILIFAEIFGASAGVELQLADAESKI